MRFVCALFAVALIIGTCFRAVGQQQDTGTDDGGVFVVRLDESHIEALFRGQSLESMIKPEDRGKIGKVRIELTPSALNALGSLHSILNDPNANASNDSNRRDSTIGATAGQNGLDNQADLNSMPSNLNSQGTNPRLTPQTNGGQRARSLDQFDIGRANPAIDNTTSPPASSPIRNRMQAPNIDPSNKRPAEGFRSQNSNDANANSNASVGETSSGEQLDISQSPGLRSSTQLTTVPQVSVPGNPDTNTSPPNLWQPLAAELERRDDAMGWPNSRAATSTGGYSGASAPPSTLSAERTVPVFNPSTAPLTEAPTAAERSPSESLGKLPIPTTDNERSLLAKVDELESSKKALEKDLTRKMLFMFLFLMCSLGANVYLGWIARGFYARFHDMANELRDTFTTTNV